MRVWQILVSVRLAFLLVLASHFAGGLSSPAWAAEKQGGIGSLDSDELTDPSPGLAYDSPVALSEIPTLNQLEHPATTVVDWVAQIEASIVQITGVRVEDTEAGLRLVLEAENGSLAVSETRSVGNARIVEIDNVTLAQEFSQTEPIEGIALVTVTELPENRVRVAITGTDAPPAVEVTSDIQGLILTATLNNAQTVLEEDEIQVVVTGEQEDDYYVPDTSVGTRTETPLRDIPQSIQVVYAQHGHESMG